MKTKLIRRLLAILLTIGLLTGTAGMLSASAKPLSPKQQAALNNYHSLGLTGVPNARDLGGYITKDGRTVKCGKLLRTGELKDATAKDLAKLSKVYKVRKVVDFRTTSSRILENDRSVPDSESLWFNVYAFEVPFLEVATREDFNALRKASSVGPGDPFMVNQYHFMVSDPLALLAFRQFFQTLLNANGASVLFHCSSGKDRTGVASFLLLYALGVPEKVAIEDYLLSDHYMGEKKQSIYRQVYEISESESLAKSLSRLGSVDRSWLQSSIRTINQYYGGMDHFLQNQMGLSKADLKKLRSLYLEP